MGRDRFLFAWLSSFALAGSGCAALQRQNDADALYSRACALDLDAQLNQAARLYRASIAATPSSPAANNLGVIYAKAGDVRGASLWFQYAVAVDEGDTVARTNLGVVLFHLGRTGEAIDTLRAARRIRQETLDHLAPVGRVDWNHDRYASLTERSDTVAARYLDRLMSTTLPPPEGLQLAQNLVLSSGRMSAEFNGMWRESTQIIPPGIGWR